MARKKKFSKPAEEQGGEMWLLPYSDLLTLLLALFIVLFAINASHKQTQEEVANFRRGFNSGGISFFSNMGPNSGRSNNISTNEQPQPRTNNMSNYMAENQQLTKAMEKVNQYIKQNNLQNEIHTQLTEEGLVVHIGEKALFASGSAQLSPKSAEVCAIVAHLLSTVKENVIISGHTDNVPIHNAQFSSNWQLSTQRALNFLQAVLNENPKLNPARFKVEGCSEYHPLVPNDTPANRAENRRVDVLLVRSYAPPAKMQVIN